MVTGHQPWPQNLSFTSPSPTLTFYSSDLDEKYRKRERYIGGAIMDFKEKESYKPQVKLEYVDDSGRLMSPKEAFRYLSHRFHGKGSGLKKTEEEIQEVGRRICKLSWHCLLL